MKKLLKINLLVLMFCILIGTPTLALAGMTVHYKVRASGTPTLVEWYEVEYVDEEILASFSLEAVDNPARFSGQFKIYLEYAAEEIFLKATARVTEIYEEGSVWGDRRVFNGEGLVIKDSEDGKYAANFQARVYEGGWVSIDIIVDDEVQVWIPGIPIERAQVIDKGKDFEEKLEEQLEKTEEKFEEKQEKLEEKFEKKEDKLEEKQEKLEEQMDKKQEKIEEKQEKIEEKYEDKQEKLEKEQEKLEKKQEKLEEKMEKKQEKLEKKQQKLEEKFEKEQEKLEEKMAKKLEKLEEKQEKNLQ